MKLYSTLDIEASVRKAYEQFTHVVLNRAYMLHRPVYFDTTPISDMALLQYAGWIPVSQSQVKRWKNLGGVLIEQDAYPPEFFPTDVTVMIEAPYSADRIKACHGRNREYGVIPNPVSWKTHEECIDLRFPTAEVLRHIWSKARGQPFTLSELATETSIPTSLLMYIKNALNPQEHWYIQKRLAPERDEFMLAWDWLESGTIPKQAISESGYKGQIEEMARFGYINLKKYNHYPEQEPDWNLVEHKRQKALTDLSFVRSLVESLPDHLET